MQNKSESPSKAGPAGTVEAKSARTDQAFLTALDSVLVDEPAHFAFDGSICRPHAQSFWVWLCRDLLPDLEATLGAELDAGAPITKALDRHVPDIIATVREAQKRATSGSEQARRDIVQMGGDTVYGRIDIILLALRSRALIDKARSFGKATNTLSDEAALGLALQSMPLKDPAVCALLMHSVLGQAAHPARLISAAVSVSGKSSEDAIINAGFAPLVDAVLAHAQNQLNVLAASVGAFTDMDKVCRSLDRFHRLLRSVTSYIELKRGSRWSGITAELTRAASARIEPRLREVSADVSQSLRPSREAVDRLDADRLLSALNGMYLLASVRDARDSLAVNAVFDAVWGETGKALEVLITRNLDEFRAHPDNAIAAQRLEQGIKMAELRYGTEYAAVLRRARGTVERRAVSTT